MPNLYMKNSLAEYDIFLTYSFILIGLYIFYGFYKRISNSLEFDKFDNIVPFPQHTNMSNRMKDYETHTESLSRVGDNTPFIVRLKGRNFKNIKNNKTYEISMHKIGMELMREFHAHTSMVFDDEIVLVFSRSLYHQFGGKCSKLLSVIASYASSSLTSKTTELCSFHCSIIDFKDNDDDLMNYIKWRNHIALSTKKTPVFIKRSIIDSLEEKPVYTHLKFTLKTIKLTDEYIELFSDPNFDPNDYNIRFKKICDMDESMN